MEPVEQATTSPTDDRRALLEQSFDSVEETGGVNRDDAGRFAQKAAEPPAEPVEEPVWRKPPRSWKPEFHEVWQKADPKMQEYAFQREEQMRAGVEPLISKAQFADSMQEAIQPYMDTIRGLGMTPDKAVAALMEADAKLRNSDPQTRTQYFMQLAQSYGINLGQAQPGVQSGAVDPMVYQLQNELNKVRGEVMGWKQQQEMAENQTLLTEIDAFSQKAEHFEDVRPTMIQLLQSGMANTLEEAYDKAIRLTPEIADRVAQARQAAANQQQARAANAAAKAARAAAVSVRSATPGAHTAPTSSDRRALLESAFAEAESRL